MPTVLFAITQKERFCWGI